MKVEMRRRSNWKKKGKGIAKLGKGTDNGD
jgi:hypothetical protein